MAKKTKTKTVCEYCNTCNWCLFILPLIIIIIVLVPGWYGTGGKWVIVISALLLLLKKLYPTI